MVFEFMEPAQWREKAKPFEINNFTLSSWVSQNPKDHRPWVLLIHGFPTCSWDWTPLWPKLEENFNLAAIDMLGFGLSQKPSDHDYKITQQADFMEGFLEANHISKAHIVAHDHGVSVAQELLARHNSHSQEVERNGNRLGRELLRAVDAYNNIGCGVGV